MRVPLQWLNDYFASPLTDTEAIARALALAGLEVEAIEREAAGFERVVTGRIVAAEAHPNADRLRVCQTDLGAEALLQIVTGAPNVQVGDVVPVALEGAKLPNGLEIKPSKLRGVESFGMYCSRRELGLEGGVDGVEVLPPDTPIGVGAALVLGVGEVVFEIAVLANRPDALSILGVARELAAAGLGTLKLPEIPALPANAAAPLAVELEAPELCPRYMGLKVENLAVGPSPEWIVKRLEACGVRSVSNVVDVTNFVMLEGGQPLHAFDAAAIDPLSLRVRRARAGERLVTLDGVERELDAEMLVIADAHAAQAIAGVMGGARSQVGPQTTAVVLEAAYFDPASVRKTAKRLGLSSESSYRFERGVDPEATGRAMARAAQLLAQVAGGKAVGSPEDARISPDYPRPIVISVRPARIARVLGAELPLDVARARLEAIGFQLSGSDPWTLTVPGWRRHDVQREIDVVEEVARLIGYEAIPATLMPLDSLRDLGRREALNRRLRGLLEGCGLSEVLTSSLVSEASLKKTGLPLESVVRLANPLAEMSLLRPSMLPGLIEVARFNHYQGHSNLALYELGKTYHLDADGRVFEPRWLAFLLVGEQATGAWKRAPELFEADFFWAKGIIERLLAALHLEGLELTADSGDPTLHPGRAAKLTLAGQALGVVGEIHPALHQQADLPPGARAAFGCLDLDALERALPEQAPGFQPFSRFPAVLRDLALVVDERLPASAVVREVRQMGGELLEAVEVFDRYQGPQVPAGKVSLGLRLRYRATEGSLSDQAIEPIHQRIVDRAQEAFGAALRQ